MNDLLNKRIRYLHPQSQQPVEGVVTAYSSDGYQLQIGEQWLSCGSIHVQQIIEDVPPGPNAPPPAPPIEPQERRLSNARVAEETRQKHGRKRAQDVPGAAGPDEFNKE